MRRTPPIAGVLFALGLLATTGAACAADLPPVPVEGQPLAANVSRLLQALDMLGAPLPEETAAALARAARSRDAERLQRLLDPQVLFVVSLNPEARVKVQRGPARALLQQAGFTPVLVKVVNESTVTKRIRITSPQAGPVYAGVAELSMKRQQQEDLRANENVTGATDRFLHVEMFAAPPMGDALSGLAVEYAIALIYSSEAGKREATIGFDIGQGNQDLGFRGEAPVLFEVRSARRVKLVVRDVNGEPTVARLLFRDALGHVHPPQPKRIAPDFFFQPHIYRRDGDVVLLPPGKFTMQSSRGPEYRVLQREVTIPAQGDATVRVELQRWIDPTVYGFYGGDHHIHAAGCAHYTSPTQGVTPADMFLQVKGEGLNVGCVLTWGPCYDHQRQFFAPAAHEISEPRSVLKYDLEISGFGSQALGHVCLLNLKEQTYPGSEGTSTKGWPTWTTPVLRWAKEQGGVTGYAHSASGLQIDPPAAAKRLLAKADRDGDGRLSPVETDRVLLPDIFAAVDSDRDGLLAERELIERLDRAAEELPNLAVPEMNGVGAMEIFVSTAEGVCDFISAMDTPRIQEWNCWYHILNCGFPLKVSGETDFPCMSSRSVGQGRVYVQLGTTDRVDFPQWCAGLAAGRSYVSDGYAHAVRFEVSGKGPGTGDVTLMGPGRVAATAQVAFAPEIPKAVAYGSMAPAAGKRVVGDTVLLHGPRSEEMETGGERLVELIVNGVAVASRRVPADGKVHEIEFDVPIERSSWVALRQFPQLHTNPVNVLVGGRPIRASRASALWCIEAIDLLWHNRETRIAPHEREAARDAFRKAIDRYRQIADEAALQKLADRVDALGRRKPIEPPPAAPPFPFSAEAARHYQRAYAEWLGLPVEWTNDLGMTFILVPPGSFLMGSPSDEPGHNAGGYDETQHPVTLTRAFYLSRHETTVGQFRRFVEATRYVTDVEKNGGGHAHDERAEWKHRPGTNWREPGFAGPFAPQDEQPVVHVSHTDGGQFCRWLAQRAGADGLTFDLPTEAQWEWACREGSDARFWWGPDEDTTGKVANVGDRSLKRVHPDWPRPIMPMDDGQAFVAPVGSFRANAFGLHDMLGNVWEFCATHYGPYPREPVSDPGDGDPQRGYAVRGGGWSNIAHDVRCASRNADPPHFGHSNLGFRVSVQFGGGKAPSAAADWRSGPFCRERRRHRSDGGWGTIPRGR